MILSRTDKYQFPDNYILFFGDLENHKKDELVVAGYWLLVVGLKNYSACISGSDNWLLTTGNQ